MSTILGSLCFTFCVSRRSLQLTLAWFVFVGWVGLLFSVGELNFDLFLTSSNKLTATVESNAATEKKKGKKTLSVPQARFAWQAWYFLYHHRCQRKLGDEVGLMWRRGLLRGRRGTFGTSGSICVAGVVLSVPP